MSIIKDLSNERYHAQHGISSSAVKTVCKKSIAHWKGEKRTATPAMMMGTAVHSLLLEEDRDLVIKGPKTKQSKAFAEQKEALKDEQVLLTEVEYNTAHCIAKGALANPACKAALRHKDRVNESSIFETCPRSGLILKTRPDLLIESEETVFDLKTTIDASPTGFAREVVKYAYHVQAFFYIYVCQLAGLDVKRFSFLAVEKSAPYVAHRFDMSPEYLSNAEETVYRTLDQIAAAEENEDFSTGWGENTVLVLPKWL